MPKLFAVFQNPKRPFVPCLRSCRAFKPGFGLYGKIIEPRHGFDVVVEHVWLSIQDLFKRFYVSFKIWNKNLNRYLGIVFPYFSYRLCNIKAVSLVLSFRLTGGITTGG